MYQPHHVLRKQKKRHERCSETLEFFYRIASSSLYLLVAFKASTRSMEMDDCTWTIFFWICAELDKKKIFFCNKKISKKSTWGFFYIFCSKCEHLIEIAKPLWDSDGHFLWKDSIFTFGMNGNKHKLYYIFRYNKVVICTWAHQIVKSEFVTFLIFILYKIFFVLFQ